HERDASKVALVGLVDLLRSDPYGAAGNHAAAGLVAHLAYTGVSEPYVVGRDVGAGTENEPE
ncbi:MAG: hypothetical protein ACXV3V_10760, partial [Actinomycetes bacterium]